ncbi:MAG: hydrogen peroxide-inducible genes activator [Bacteroidetes bacterium]|nr:hydrogen peroxide-inducible genes activator [Bacteroidota bacterium]
MTIQQFEYIIALDECRHFVKAAQKCFITQPTLSMMINKLEEELGLKIFDRTKHPVAPTKEGEELIKLAKAVILKTRYIKEYVAALKGELTGDIRIGIIPTLAPYLVPLFIKEFVRNCPGLNASIKELATPQIITGINNGDIDIGILATPVNEASLTEHPLFYEEFYAYASLDEKLPKKKYLLPKEINIAHLWLLEEGHCFRNQVYNLCQLKKEHQSTLNYEAGSIETLINLVDHSKGITLIPKLAEMNLKPSQKKFVREFANPKPVREISLVVKNNFIRIKIIEQLKDVIIKCLPSEMINSKNKKITSIDS